MGIAQVGQGAGNGSFGQLIERRRKSEQGVEMAATENEQETLLEAQARADRAEHELQKLKRDDEPRQERTATDDDEADALSELRKDSMMSHLMDALDGGADIGHYGRLVFAMVASKFMPKQDVVAWLRKDNDFSEEQAEAMMSQVETRDYNPPRRERILEWQREQEFQIIPDVHDPDCGNVYRSLRFPKDVYKDIETYQVEKAAAEG